MKQSNNETIESNFFEAHYPDTSRQKEIAQILTYIQEGNSCQIISVPGAGRSNLLGLLAYNDALRTRHLGSNKEQYHFVMINFSEIKNKPLTEATKLIFFNLLSSLEDRPLDETYEKVQTIFKDSVGYNDELMLFQGLKKAVSLITLEKKKRLVLLFDKFDEYIPMLTPTFFMQLKVLHDLAKYQFCVVFSLHKPLEYFLEPEIFADFEPYSEDHLIYLLLHDEPSLNFRISYIASLHKNSLPEQTKQLLYETSAGHAKLTRLSVEKLLEKDTLPQNQDELCFFLLSQKAIQKTLEHIWHALNPAEQTHFLKELYPSILADEHSDYLIHVGLMTQTSIAMPLFAAYVEQKRQGQQEINTHLHLNNNTNTITKGAQNISDNLTATEFSLLKFFLQHIEQIIDRETLIAAVWKENKSLAGVSDQALDQLIFRLRKKIEDDPNHPTHLQTIKGRGFKLTP